MLIKYFQNNKILLIVAIFFGLCLLVQLVHPCSGPSDFIVRQNNAPSANPDVISADKYPQYVRVWLVEVPRQDPLPAVRAVREKITNFRGDLSLGRAHISLLLAFDSLEQYLVTKDLRFKDRAGENLSQVVQLFPELAPDIARFKTIIN
ncbi:MAG: hypothetical protein C3F02_03555 [Parcubacteria group bacterium]|nr:MAG: hypothetical protein C3F02_03555 [Parcubacteria group bacterium]